MNETINVELTKDEFLTLHAMLGRVTAGITYSLYCDMENIRKQESWPNLHDKFEYRVDGRSVAPNFVIR